MISLKQFTEALNDRNTIEDFDNIKKIGNKLKKHYSFTGDKEYKKHIKDYTEGNDINGYLWEKYNKKNKDLSEDNIQYHEKHYQGLQSALKKYKTPHDLEIYSSTIHDPAKIKDKNNIFHHPAFMSTSIDRNVSNDWGNIVQDSRGRNVRHILKIHVPKGSPGAYVEHLSACKGQHEFILPAGSNFKYHHTEILPGLSGRAMNHYHHVSLEPEFK